MKLKHNYGNQVYHIFFHRPEGLDWAQNTTNGNMSWRGNVLFSYSSELGWVDFDKKIIWIRNGTYSNTTSKHQHYLRASVPPDWKIIYISNWWDWTRGWDKAPSYYKELEHIVSLAKENKEKLYKNTKDFGKPKFVEHSVEEAQRLLNVISQEDLFESFVSKITPFIWTPADTKVYEVKTWCRDNGITGSYETKLKVYNNPELAEEVIEKNRIRKEKLEATKEERRLKAIQRNIEKWYSGETGNINWLDTKRRYYHTYSNHPVYLRIKPSDDKMVQTSLNAEVPLIECQLLYRKFKQCRDTNTTWHQNGEKFRIGYYHVDRIELYYDEYQLVAGCHVLKNTQIEEFVNRFTNWNKNE